MKLNVKWIYVLVVLLIAASALGCIGQKKTDTGAIAPTPAQNAGNDVFGTESEANQLDSMLNDTTMDISLSDVPI